MHSKPKEETVFERCKCPNNGLFIIALVLLITFLLVEVFIRSYNLYYSVPIVDVPSHFFAGMAICAGIFWIVSLNNVRNKKTVAVIYTLAAAIVWEILETLEELVVPNPLYLKDIFFWDGFFDIIATVTGGLFVFLFLHVIKKKTELLRNIKI